MTIRYLPTVRNLIYSLLTQIHNHPLIKNPPIYFPSSPNTKSEQAKITQYRTYDGKELIEPGLCLSVFPNYSSDIEPVSVKYKPETMGPKSPGFLYEVTYDIVIAIMYQAVSLNEEEVFRYVSSKENNNKLIVINENTTLIDKKKITDNLLEEQLINDQTFTIQVNPGEEILRDYLDLIRLVLDDIPSLLPWNTRFSYTKGYNFPTTSWESKSENIYFHRAYLNYEISLFSPAVILNSLVPAISELLIKDTHMSYPIYFI